MLKTFVIASMLASGASVAAPLQQGDPFAQIGVFANAYDRCMTTFAVKLLDSGLSDDQLYVVASTMCRDLNDQLNQRINATLPRDKAEELITRINVDPKGDYLKKLKAIRQGRAQSRK